MLIEDGRYSTLSRARDPEEDDIDRAEEGLQRQGRAGWLAIMSGTEYTDTMPTFLEVRPFGHPTVRFDDAVRLCEAAILARRD